MEKTTQLIIKNKDKFPDFEYYLSIIDKINENIHLMPDVAIESCKSLVEGVSKKILDILDEPYIEKGRNADSPDNLVKKAIDSLSKYSSVDSVFSHSVCSFIKRTAEVRNERGDISHGRSAPKKSNSDRFLSEMIAHTTDGMVFYILNIFFNTALPDFSDIKYEDNGEFNEYLDSENGLSGIKFSLALYDQDPIAYKEQLASYLSDS